MIMLMTMTILINHNYKINIKVNLALFPTFIKSYDHIRIDQFARQQRTKAMAY